MNKKSLLPSRRSPLLALLLAAAAGAAEETPQLPEITVVGSRSPQEMRRNASTAKIVYGREDLETLDANSVGELLRKLPGTGLAADMESRRNRGKGPDRMMPRILVDGQAMPGGDRNPGAALRLSPDLIERVEIIRNGSAEFPSAGPGGIINLVLRDVPPKATRSARIGLGSVEGEPLSRLEGQIGEQLGDFGYLLAGSFNSRPTVSRRETEIQRFTASVPSAWTVERGSEQGRDNNLSLSPRFNWNLGQGQQFSLSPFLSRTEDERQGRIERYAYANPVAGTGYSMQGLDRERDDTRRTSGRLNAEWKTVQMNGSELSARLMLQGEEESRRRAVTRRDAGGFLLGTNDDYNERRDRQTALILRGKRLLAESHIVSGGAEWHLAGSDERRQVRNNGVLTALGADGASSLDDFRQILWSQDEWQLNDQHLLTPGLRWQQQKSRIVDGVGTAMTRDYSFLDPSLHYLWQPSATWNLRSSIAQSSRPPQVRDLSPVVRTGTGANSPGSPDRGGNSSLVPERSLSLEAGVEHFLAARKGTIGFSVFQRWIDNQVQRLTLLEGGRWVERPYNVGDAVLNGGILDFKVLGDILGTTALSSLTLRGNFALSRTHLENPPPGLGAGEGPRRSWNLGFDYEIPSQRLTLGANLTHVSALDRDSSATVRQTQAARRQFDVYALQKLDRQLSLRFSAQNLNRAGQDFQLREVDPAGNPTRLESEHGKGIPTYMLSLEGKW